jgi:hypothetical protein
VLSTDPDKAKQIGEVVQPRLMRKHGVTSEVEFEREAQTIRANEQWARANPRSGILIGGSPRRPKDRIDVFRCFRDPGSDCRAIKERPDKIAHDLNIRGRAEVPL